MSQNTLSIFVHVEDKSPPSFADLRAKLESPNDEQKIDAMKRLINAALSGDKVQSLLMHTIQYVLPTKNHQLKKMFLLFLEIVDKKGEDGKVLSELILICDRLIQDLKHPNEYLRGAILRFLGHLEEPVLLEPTIESITKCLSHKDAYVRRNAVLCLHQIHEKFNNFFPDAAEILHDFLLKEADINCQRNAFLALFHVGRERAINYLLTNTSKILDKGEPLQLVAVEIIRKTARESKEISRYLKMLFNLLQSGSPAVRFEAAAALINLSSATTAVRAGVSAYLNLLNTLSDTNVKLILLDRLVSLKKRHATVLQESLMDILRVLSNPSQEIRKKALDMAMGLVTRTNVEETVLYLRKEISKTLSTDVPQSEEYRKLLIQAIHSCAVKFPDVAENVVFVLMDFLSESGPSGACDVIIFVREVVETYPDLRASIVAKLIEVFHNISRADVCRAALWIIGEYSEGSNEIIAAFSGIVEALGPVPLTEESEKEREKEREEKEKEKMPMSPASSIISTATSTATSKAPAPLVLPDGTYATQYSAQTTEAASTGTGANTGGSSTDHPTVSFLRQQMISGDFFIGSSLANALVKLILRYDEHIRAGAGAGEDTKRRNELVAEAVLMLAAVVESGDAKISREEGGKNANGSGSGGGGNASTSTSTGETQNQRDKGGRDGSSIDPASRNRILTCIRFLTDINSISDEARTTFLRRSRHAFTQMLKEEQMRREAEQVAAEAESMKTSAIQADDTIKFPQLLSRKGMATDSIDFDDMEAATGTQERTVGLAKRLSRIHQLTGLSDPVYAEADVKVHAYDIVLDILVVNQTPNTLHNLALELATLGDLKLCEKPQTYTIGPCDRRHLRANVKVSSTETGIIFGNIVYDIAGSASADKNYVVLTDIHIDIIDYIVAATCTHAEFRRMWAEFEWENKVSVSADFDDLTAFLRHLIAMTNMKCLTPVESLGGACQFLAANLYARSIFGEDALCNVSVEKSTVDGRITGYIRIRSKTQGIALSLGDKITLKQNVKL